MLNVKCLVYRIKAKCYKDEIKYKSSHEYQMK